MTTQTSNSLIPDEIISSKMFIIRDVKIMLDKDLAELYGVSTGNLNKAVKRNIKGFRKTLCFNSIQMNLKS
jgi:hypothetical protein